MMANPNPWSKMMNEKDYSEFEEACKIEHKSSVLRDMWNAIRKDDRPIGK